MLLTVGHGTLGAGEFADLLLGAGVRRLIDIRIAPGSRRNPHLARAELQRWLPESGVEYRWERRLGGFRRPPPASPDTGLRNSSFRGYAAHMRSTDFADAVDEVLAARAGSTGAADTAGPPPAVVPEPADGSVVMCSETLWWRCHRRLVADYVWLVRRVPVAHLMPNGRTEPHRVTDTATLLGGRLVYPAPAVASPTPEPGD